MEDLILQFPNDVSEMLFPAQKSKRVVNRRINKMLKFITVSIPDGGRMEVINNNMVKLFFAEESGTIELPNGLLFEDTEIYLTNTKDEPARFNFRLIFV